MNLTKIKNQIKKLAQNTENKELCGLIVINNSNLELIPCKNESIIPNKHFQLSGRDQLYARSRGKIEFVYHTHRPYTMLLP